MATLEDDLKDLREKNNELVQKVQYWKMTAAQREDEKLALMKEINELRLKLSRLRSTGGVQAREFDAAVQATSERALAHLVRASGEIAHTIELAKTYMRDRQELDAQSPRWSALGGTPEPRTDRVHRVPPMMLGGQSIQPVVALSRTMLTNTARPAASRSPNRTLTGRAVPVHMLQDVYIPLTRIDANNRQSDSAETEADAPDADNSAEDLGLEDSAERMDESLDMTESEDFDASRRLDAVTEDVEPEDEVQTPPTRRLSENPLEGPSWLLDTPEQAQQGRLSTKSRSGAPLEPDSTTEVDEAACGSPPTDERTDDEPQAGGLSTADEAGGAGSGGSCVFTPTVRRRKRTRDSHDRSPVIPQRRNSNSGRVLKVLVAKMRLNSSEQASPPKRSASVTSVTSATSVTSLASLASMSSPPLALARLDAPSPNGATDAALLVSEATDSPVQPMDVASPHGRRDSRHERLERNAREKLILSDPELDRSDRDDRPDRHDRPDRKPNTHDRQTNRLNNTDRHDRSDDCSDRFVSVERGSRAGSEVSALSSDGRDSDSDPREGRTRRARKPITYKEKPLNRKLRR